MNKSIFKYFLLPLVVICCSFNCKRSKPAVAIYNTCHEKLILDSVQLVDIYRNKLFKEKIHVDLGKDSCHFLRFENLNLDSIIQLPESRNALFHLYFHSSQGDFVHTRKGKSLFKFRMTSLRLDCSARTHQFDH